MSWSAYRALLACLALAAPWFAEWQAWRQGDGSGAGVSEQKTADGDHGGHPGDGLFSDLAQRYGLDFVHFNGMSGELYLPEITGHGGALLDYDNDGDLDAYLVQGALLGPGKTLDDALFPPEASTTPSDKLYRNDLVIQPEGDRVPRFVDVTEATGIRAFEYGMGVATGDFNNDGWADLYVTNLGENQLFQNNGDGTFTDVTVIAGTGDRMWSTSASFFDFDRDGWLDLYVANYVEFSLEKNPRCYSQSSRRDYCGPDTFDPQPDSLFRNRADGTFEEISTKALVSYRPGPGLGAVTADYNGDGWTDIYVANDGRSNQLWINQRDGTFRDEALLAGVAVNRDGLAEASMGVDAGDFDGDGDEDLFMTHLMGETNTLYVNDSKGMFEDRTIESGLAAESLAYTSFGTAWFDYDNDGWLDLVILNGAVRILEPLARVEDPFPLHQKNQLFHNVKGEGFAEVTHQAGEVFALSEVSRGAAFGDVDNDGDTDVLMLNNNGPARLLINTTGNQRPWLGLRLVGREANRDMLGARVSVIRPDNSEVLWRRVQTDGSYCSASDPRLLIGLGSDELIAVRVHLPDGEVREWKDPAVGRYLTLFPTVSGR